MKLKKCPNCGKSVLAIAKVCKHCNYSFEAQDMVQNEMPQTPLVPEQIPDNQHLDEQPQTKVPKENRLGWFLSGICFLIPLVGLIVWLSNKKNNPGKARNAGTLALIGFVSSLFIGKLNVLPGILFLLGLMGLTIAVTSRSN